MIGHRSSNEYSNKLLGNNSQFFLPKLFSNSSTNSSLTRAYSMKSVIFPKLSSRYINEPKTINFENKRDSVGLSISPILKIPSLSPSVKSTKFDFSVPETSISSGACLKQTTICSARRKAPHYFYLAPIDWDGTCFPE